MKPTCLQPLLLCACLVLAAGTASAHFKTTPDSPIHIDERGNLHYKPYPNSDRVPDFSYCGYRASEAPIPNVAVKVIVPWKAGDATARIQRAIDYVSSLPANADGFRGTVLLEKGTYEIDGSLLIRTSGVVLRGSGSAADGTVLRAKGEGRETLIRIAGRDDRRIGEAMPVADGYVPVNANVLTLSAPHGFQAGDRVIVTRPSTEEWLRELGTDRLGHEMEYNLVAWKPGEYDIRWERTVTTTTPTSVTLDVPLTASLDPQYGGGAVAGLSWDGRIRNAGVENLRCVSDFDASNPKDENHRWMAVTVENAEDCWVRRLTAEHFVSSAVALWETARRITVEDCKSLAPVGEIGNWRRLSFQTRGQQTLFQRCYAEYGYHDFSVGFTAPGPNAFVQCQSHVPYHFSGATGGWCTGVLFDKVTVEGGSLSYDYRDMDNRGAGWCAANSLFWQCRAGQIRCMKPPTAMNWAYGSWTQPYGNGHYELSHTFVKPESIFYAQLKARTGKSSPEEAKVYAYATHEATRVTPEYAAVLSRMSQTPDTTMYRWIDLMIEKYPLVSETGGAVSADEIAGTPRLAVVSSMAPALEVKNGKLVRGDRLVTGGQSRSTMWISPARGRDKRNPAPNLTYFDPGRTGRGKTDDLDTLVRDMVRNHVAVYAHAPALWYECRRSDHERNMRSSADVWGPFLEMPFSRSGQGEAYDRLSKYDLYRFNPWYWSRLKGFADRADRQGLVLFHEHYLQHNIIEEGAHWVDYPWRSANNVNDLGFMENTPFAGDKRVYMAVEFYDISRRERALCHRNYILQSLKNFGDNDGVIHSLGNEYTGPLHFVKFWLDIIGDWEKQNGRNALACLTATKDVEDVVLADPRRNAEVDIIDIRQWHYREDGSLYAPKGGQSLAPRQHARLVDPGKSSFDQIYRAVLEYRTKYPDKAVIYSANTGTAGASAGWAVLMAGGSLARIPHIADPAFNRDAAVMSPMEEIAVKTLQRNQVLNQKVLGKPGTGYIVYSDRPTVSLNLTGDRNKYRVCWIDPATGEIAPQTEPVEGGYAITLTAPFRGAAVAWFRPRK